MLCSSSGCGSFCGFTHQVGFHLPLNCCLYLVQAAPSVLPPPRLLPRPLYACSVAHRLHVYGKLLATARQTGHREEMGSEVSRRPP